MPNAHAFERWTSRCRKRCLDTARPSEPFSEVGPRLQDSNEQSLVGKENNALFSRSYGASIEQPLFRGGQTVAAVRGAENTVRTERARLESTEQTVLLNAATAYSDVYRDQAVLELNMRNEQRLAQQLEAARDRFRVGEVTRTDVSQAEARLARATDAAAGELTARQLDLPVVYYDVNQHYQEVHDEWVGGSSSGDVSRDFDNRPARTSPLRRRGLDGSARPDEYGSNPSR